MDTKNPPRVKGKFLVSKPLFLGSRLVLGGVYMAVGDRTTNYIPQYLTNLDAAETMLEE